MESKKISFRFKGHEKFPVREGWINKGLEAIKSNPKAFSNNFVCDELGVGKNMANSIRYWMKAFNLIKEAPGKSVEINPIANDIYKYDKYFEDNFTLWILHSNLVRNRDQATSWYTFFNECDVDEFTKDEIVNMMLKELRKIITSDTLESSVKDDMDVLLNMYCDDRKHELDPEDKNICPLSYLGLITKKKDMYFKKEPDLYKINDWVILYELLNIMQDRKSVSLDEILQGKNSIGSIYNLSKVSINQYLDELENMKYIRVIRTAGLDTVVKETNLSADDVIGEYYEQR